jgi:hypothetical protein
VCRGAAMGDNTIVDRPLQPGVRGIFVSDQTESGGSEAL